jgi:outer membrane protein insertion porin family
LNLRTASAACLLAALACLSPGAARAQGGGELPEELRVIASVKYQGMKKLGGRELRSANLKTRRPSRLPWRERPSLRLDYLRADTAAIRGLYRHYGFLDASVRWELRPSRDPTAAIVVFVIDEGPRSKVDQVQLVGVTEFHEREVRKPLLAQHGRYFDPAYLAIDTLSISRLYQERGFLPSTDARAWRGQPDSVAVNVRYDIHEGPRYAVGTIEYEGTGPLKESLARRELLLKPGDTFRRSRIEESVERLYDTGLYSQVQISSFTDTAAAKLDFLLRVTERKPRWVDVGIGAGSVDMFRFVGTWGHRNVDKNALLGSLDGLLAVDRQRQDASSDAQVVKVRQARFSANLVEPWLLGVRLQGQLSAFYEEASDDRDYRFLHLRDARGLEAGLLREFSRIFRASVTGHTWLVHQSYVIFVEADSTTRDSLSHVLPRYWDNGIALSLFRDTRNDRIAPTRGSLQTLVAEMAGGPLQGQSSFRKLHMVSTWYSPRPNGWGVASRLSGGVMAPTGDPPSDFAPGAQDSAVARVPKERRFFLGGVNSLRGFGENAIPLDGGLAMLLANLELRIPLLGPLGAEAFVDVGNVWPRAEYIKASDFVAPWNGQRGLPGDIRWSYGIGARLLLPFGPLRMDLSWSEHPEFRRSTVFGVPRNFAYQFAIGPSF